MHKARPGRGLRPFQVALLILGSRLAPHNLYRYFRGGPGHRREKRINLSTSELCPEAPVLCAQSQSTSCGMHRKKLLLDLGAFVGCQGPHAGPPMAGRPFVSPGQRGHGSRGTQAPAPPLFWHFHRPPPVLCSQSTGFRHGDSQNSSESILGGRPGHHQSGQSSGSHELRGRLPAMHLVSTPDPNPGRAPRLDVVAPVMCTPVPQCMA